LADDNNAERYFLAAVAAQPSNVSGF